MNPVFVLPGRLNENLQAMAEGLVWLGLLLGVGQFCTCPGLAFGFAR